MRRIAKLAMAGVLSLLVAPPAMAAGPACLKLPPAKVAFQLFTVYEVVSGPLPRPAPGQPFPLPKGAPKPLAELFAEMKGMGWRNMENFAGTWGLAPDVYEKLVAQSGLNPVSSHDDLEPAQWSVALDRAVAMHLTYVGASGFGEPGFDTLAHTLQTAAALQAHGEAAAKRGLKFFVHSHQAELNTRFDIDLDGSGKTQSLSVFDIVAAKTDPRYVNFEVDVGWAAAAYGLDQSRTADFLRRHRDRIVLLHVKDMTPDSKPTDLGRGLLDYGALLDAAGPQVAYYIWEYDHPPAPLDSARIAFRYMTCAG